ncbi:MAG: alpha-glucosidase [Roseburia sp.]|nr:alpha-glucosidase [Roseburia sp.]MCM1097521.1 alpha-glucosidase [Ruminococcus flavefaciens]
MRAVFDIGRFERMELEIGSGENRFTMKRGSFSYRKKESRYRRLALLEKREREGGYDLVYSGFGAEEIRLSVRIGENRLKVSWQGGVPEGVNRFRLSFPADEREHFYGCGETYSKLDLKGELVRIWVAEHQNMGRISGKIIREKLLGRNQDRTLPFRKYESYYAQPTFVSSSRYFVHVETDAYSEFDFRRPDRITLNLQEPPRFTVGWGDSFEKVSENLSALLGRPRALPDWIYDGGILAVQEGAEAVERKLEKAFEAGAAVNGVWCQDWCGCRRTGFGYQVMWNWRFDETLYPDLPERIRKWRERGVRFLGYINPFLAIEKELYREASGKGYCVKDREGKDYLVTITTFPAAMIDLTNPAAYEWYKGLIRENMIGVGMSGWMADFGEYLPVDCVLYSGADPEAVHNTWPALWAKLNREAIAECGMEEEIFFFTRAGYTGTVAHSDMMWTGDQHVDWSVDDGLPSVIPATLSLAMSGFCVTHSDVGGYTTILHMRRGRELLLRWEEMNAFSPLFRSHEGNQPVNNVQFDGDGELLEQLAHCTGLHTGLKPYLKKCEAEARERGIPVMRPLFYHYDEEALYTEKTEYLLGRDILVAPVLKEGAAERVCILPGDQWVHLFTGEEYGGGKHTVAAPIGRPPVFVRRASEVYEKLMGSV